MSFCLRKTDIWVDWKVGRCPIWLGTGSVNPKAPSLGQAGLALCSQPAAGGSSCLHEITRPPTWHGTSSPQDPGPSLYLRGLSCSTPRGALHLSILKTRVAPGRCARLFARLISLECRGHLQVKSLYPRLTNEENEAQRGLSNLSKVTRLGQGSKPSDHRVSDSQLTKISLIILGRLRPTQRQQNSGH